MSQYTHRTKIQTLYQNSTVKLLCPSKNLIGTGFYVLPNVLATCLHVLEDEDNASYFDAIYIEGNDTKFVLADLTIHTEDAIDLVLIEFTTNLSKNCISLENTISTSDDSIWGHSFNEDYEDGVVIVSRYLEEARHHKHKDLTIYRIKHDTISPGSSGTPLLHLTENKLFGVVFWLKEEKENALVIPAKYFEDHFCDIYSRNITYHKETGYYRQLVIEENANLCLSKSSDGEHKILCIYDIEDNTIIEYYDTMKIYLEEKDSTIVHGLSDMCNNVHPEASLLELNAADTVIFLLNGARFDKFWNNNLTFLNKEDKLFEDKQVIFVPVDELTETIKNRITQKCGKDNVYQIPISTSRWKPTYLSAAKGVEDAINNLFMPDFNEILGNSQTLRDAVQKFDLRLQVENFREQFDEDKKINVVIIEGEEYSGQDLLMKRNLTILQRKWNKLPHLKRIAIQQNKITSSTELWKHIAIEVTGERFETKEKTNKLISQQLEEQNITLLIDDLVDRTKLETSSDEIKAIIGLFWTDFLHLNEGIKPKNQLFIFIINRAGKKYGKLNSIKLKSFGTFNIINQPYIEQVTENDLEAWQENYESNAEIVAFLRDSCLNIEEIFPDFLENAIINLKPYFGLTAKDIEIIKSL